MRFGPRQLPREPHHVTPGHEPPRDGADCAWLTDAELAVYAAEYARSGFQGALQGYRCRMDGSIDRDLARFAFDVGPERDAVVAGRACGGVQAYFGHCQ